MPSQQTELNLITSPIPKTLNKLFIPASVGFFFSVLYNVVDTYYGGKISSQTLAALSLSFPIYFIIIALIFGFSGGCSALIATLVGKDKKEDAKQFYCQCLSFGFFLVFFTSLIGIIFSEILLKILGAKGSYLQESLDYILIIFYGSFAIVGVGIINSGLSALGKNKPSRNSLIASFLANIILDFWFVFGGLGIPPLGIKGIAWATVISHIGSVFYLLHHAKKTFLLKNISLTYFIPRKNCYQQILAQGIPATFNMLSISIYFFIINSFLSGFGQEAIAAYGIGLRIEQLFLVPGIGLSIAVSTLVAQNHGARLEYRVRETIRIGMIYSGIMMLFGWFFLVFAGRLIMGFFTKDTDIISIGVEYLNIEAWTLLSYTFIHVASSALQGLKKPSVSFIINLVGRFLPLPILYIFINILNFQTTAIWYTILFNNWFMGIAFIFFLQKTIKKSFLIPLGIK